MIKTISIEELLDMGVLAEDALKFDNPDFENAIVGFTHDGRIVYSLDPMILSLALEDGITEEEAREYIDYNTLRTIPYMEMSGKAPVIVNLLSTE